MAMLGKIRAMHLRDGKSISEIARLTSLSRNTIKKWLKASSGAAPRYRRREVPGKLAAYVEQLLQALKADAQRPKRERRTVKALHAELQAAGYTGGYTRLTDYVRAWRLKQSASIATSAFVPLSFALGEAFQFDWSEEGLVVGGIYRRLQVAHMKLCASRAFWLVAYPTQGHEMLFDAHTRSFAALGGVARRGIYDNMKTAVDKVNKGKGRIVNARFAALCAHYLVDADFCNDADRLGEGACGEERAGQPPAHLDRCGAAALRQLRRTQRLAGGALPRPVERTPPPRAQPVQRAEVLEHERAHLMPMPEPFDGYVERPARVSSTCLVAVQRNRYSVPCELAGQMVSARLYPTRVVVVADEAIVARHERLANRGQTRYDWQHYIPLVQRKPGALRNGAPFADMPEPLRKLQAALTRKPGGDRVMAQVLAAVPSAGLDAVLVAVELVLETGAASAEHVLNVLGRLNAAAVPDNVDTALSLNDAPRANTQRYDALRDEAADREVRHA
jgi:transposase